MDEVEEEWKPVTGNEGAYEVTAYGRVRRASPSFGHSVGRELTWVIGKYGYPYVTLCINGKKRNRKVHKLVAEAFLGPCPEGIQVNHKDFNRGNPHLDNLEYVTQSQNLHHAYDHGRSRPKPMPGEANPSAKLSTDQVREIRASDESHRVLANRYGVNKGTISKIRRGAKWKHV